MPQGVKKERIILGIDPGTNIMGYALIKATGRKPELIVMGVLQLNKYKDHYSKLQKIFDCVTQLIVENSATELAIEAPFFGVNVQSMLKLGRAQGVAISAALVHQLPVFEYAPRKIKNAITGQGTASKEQVAAILKHELQLTDLPQFLDATDALGAAVCHFYQASSINRSTGVASVSSSKWADYIKNNPGRIKRSK